MRKVGGRILAQLGLVASILLINANAAPGQNPSAGTRQFPPGSVRQVEDLPPGRFRQRLQELPEAARLRALEWLRDFHFTELDLQSLQVDAAGGVYYADVFTLDPAPAPSADEPVIAGRSEEHT